MKFYFFPLRARQVVGKRDLLFIGICFCGIVAVAGSLLHQGPLHNSSTLAVAKQTNTTSLQDTVEQVDKAFARDWSKADLQSAAKASDLLVARRLSLALAGTIPSFEEIRALQQLPA
ncbi:MAG: hypothetical protein VB862_11305, partial [Pirellulaceae bacterium]